MPPKIAVAAAPQLAAALKRAGFTLFSEDTDPRNLAALLRATDIDNKELFVLTPAGDSTMRTWVESLVSQGRRVLVLGEVDPPVRGTRQVALPAAIDDVMAKLSAPPSPEPFGDAVLMPDLSIVDPWVEDETGEEEEDDPWAGQWADSPTASAPTPAEEDDDSGDVVPAPVFVSDDFGPVEPRPAPLGFDDFIPSSVPHPAPAPEPQPVRPAPAPVAVAPRPEPVAAPRPQPVAPATQPQPRPEPVAPAPRPAPVTTMPRPEPVAPTWQQAAAAQHETQPWQTPAPVQASRRPSVGDEFANLVPASAAVTEPGTGALAPVVFVFAGKGGVAKSSTALLLAQRAYEVGGLKKVILVDGSRGQGDLRKILRVGPNQPSIYDATLRGNPRGAILPPKRINESRDSRLPPVGFGIIMAPRDGQSDPSVVTASVYADAVESAREFGQLVIVDTQIVEDTDTSGLWSGVWEALLRSSTGWGVGLSDNSTHGLSNLVERLSGFQDRGIGPDRMLLALTRIPPETQLDLAAVKAKLGQFGTVVGTVPDLPDVGRGFEVGRLPHDVPEQALVLDSVLYKVTGLPEFDPERPGGPAEQLHGGRGGFLGWFRKGGAR